MLMYGALNYLSLSLLFALLLFDAGRPYTFGATLVLMALIFVGPQRMKGEDLKAEVPKSQYWWLILFVAFLFFAPFYRVSTGRDLLDLPDNSLKIVVVVAWAFVTALFARNVFFALVRDKA